MSPQPTLTISHLQLIDALAAIDVQDYLREQAALRQASNADRSNQVPLPSLDEAA